MHAKSAVRRGAQLLLAVIATAGLLGAMPTSASAGEVAPVTFHAWNNAGFALGQFNTSRPTVVGGRVALALAPGATTGSWTSPVYRMSVPIGDIVPSWQATTPTGSWIETHLSVGFADGHWSQWYRMGSWAFENTPGFQRTSVNDQSDADGTIYTDTYVADDNGTPNAYRLRTVLYGTSAARPLVFQLAATTSNVQSAPPTSTTTMSRTIDLAVPTYSQMTHIGEYPAYGGGGEVWCSPTSTAMVMAYWRRGPSAADLASLPADPVFDAHHRADPQVDYAALHTWDAAYEGTGNWPFNTAYASAYGLDGSVRQYGSLVAVEGWIKRGVPVVVSIAWNNTDTNPDGTPRTDNDLAGAPIAKTGGHLMVVRGFTSTGNVIAGDPAAATNADVRRIYKRDQFEHNWINRGSGATYIIKPLSIGG